MAAALLEQLMNDIKGAMKARETDKLTVFRMLHAQIKDAGTNAGKEETDELVAEVVAKAIKQRNESIRQYRDGGRDDLADQEEQEAEWITAYQPEQLTEEAIADLARAAIEETGAGSPKEMGLVMKALMPKVKGKADGKRVSQTVQKLLSG